MTTSVQQKLRFNGIISLPDDFLTKNSSTGIRSAMSSENAVVRSSISLRLLYILVSYIKIETFSLSSSWIKEELFNYCLFECILYFR